MDFLHSSVTLFVSIVLVCQGVIGVPNPPLAREICQGDNFNAQCKSDEVIVVTSAMYGLMKLGKCLQTDSGFTGCATDVIRESDRLCSGKQTCQIPVPNEEMKALDSCPGDMPSYLEILHKCQQVVALPETCTGESIHVEATGKPSYLSSNSLSQLFCGESMYGLTLQAKPGQQIQLDLLNFNVTDSVEDAVCKVLGMIRETVSGTSKTICDGTERESLLYYSYSHQVALTVFASLKTSNFLFVFKAIGCPDLVAPVGTTITNRTGNETVVKCINSGKAWLLKCSGSAWIGVVGNCPATVKSTTTVIDQVENTIGQSTPQSVAGGVPSTTALSILHVLISTVTLIVFTICR